MRRNKAFVLGQPVGHSRSPMLHGYWLKKEGIDGSYERREVAPVDLDAFFAHFRDSGWVGGNVTVPHKTAVIPYLDRIDADAEAMGAVNTVYWEGDKLIGGNSDAIGFLGNIDELVPGWDRNAKRAVILGAGGATRAAAYGLLNRGLEVAICNRTLDKAKALAKHFGQGATAHPWDDYRTLIADCDVLVNCTSLGMLKQPPLDVDLSNLKPGAVVYDVIYVPLETEFLKAAKARGHKTVDGLGMLLHQGVKGFSRWFEKTPEVTPELRQLLVDDIRAKTPGA